MIIAIISEPRSGSANLYKWLKESLPNYEHIWELIGHTQAMRERVYYNKEWFDNTKNYIVNEKCAFRNIDDMHRLVTSADVSVALYREDAKAQVESFVTARLLEQWGGEYTAPKHIINNIDTVYEHLKTHFLGQKELLQELIKTHDLKSFTYEDLYYRNKIGEFKEYIGIESVIPFPYGKKYRTDEKPSRLL